MPRSLNVFMGPVLAGTLEQDDSGALSFAYEESWLANASAVPLSASLPLRQGKFKQSECRSFFAGLLPEEDVRKLAAQALGVSERNDFSILERIGAECAGAISLLRPGEAPSVGMDAYEEISNAELSTKLVELTKRPLLVGSDGIRLSLAGAQSKFALRIREESYYLPKNGSPSSHIVKPASSLYPGLVENEFFCMRLAASVDLSVAQVELREAGGIMFLEVARYDRAETGQGKLARIHQEDFCQALGIPPERKYQTEGGPTLKQCFALLRQISSRPGPDALKLFDAIVFNYLIGNCDAHGKNFSFLYGASGAALSPLYDLVCTRAFPEVSKAMAMKIGGEKEGEKVRAKEWRKFFADSGLGPGPASKRLKALTARVAEALSGLEDLPGFPQVAPIVRANCQRVEMLNWILRDEG